MTATSMIWRDLEKRRQHGLSSCPAILCARIQAAALTCGDYHIFVDWQPHVACLSVCVRDKQTDYSADVDTWPDALLSERAYLDSDWCDPIEGLTRIIDQLQRLGVEV